MYHARPGIPNPHVTEQRTHVRILILQFAPDTRGRPIPRYEPNLAVLLTLLKQRGHDLSLLGLARHDVSAVKAALAKSLPQLIYADVSAVCVNAARRTFQYIQEHEFLPIVVGGEYATADPAGALSLPGVQAAAIGEPDASLVTHFERLKDPAVGQIVQGIWLRDEQGLARPELPSLIEDLDSLPFGERELFGYADYVLGTGEIEIAVGRGCPERCSYCLNEPTALIYSDRGIWDRRRSPENVISEIELLREQYPEARLLRFLDHHFALDVEWLEEFLAVYKDRGRLPFRCHLRANGNVEDIVLPLADAGCKLADIEIISASDFIRNEIFAMDLDELQIRATFEALRTAGVKTRAIVYLGAPYDSEASLEDARALLRRIRPDTSSIRPYYPWPGTAAAATCSENGWTHSRGEEQYQTDKCGVDMPACRPADAERFIKRLRKEFSTRLSEPWWRRWSQASRNSLGQFFQKRQDF